jgi:hypothetical protein
MARREMGKVGRVGHGEGRAGQAMARRVAELGRGIHGAAWLFSVCFLPAMEKSVYSARQSTHQI